MECLDFLANTNCFGLLQEKMNTWKYEFKMNCPEANIGRCCELLELNAKIQSQLFKLLGVCALHGGLNGSDSRITEHLQSYLGYDYLKNGLTKDVVMDILNDLGHHGKLKSSKRYRKKVERVRSRDASPVKDKSESAINGEIKGRLNDLEDAIIELSHDQKTATRKKKKKRSLNNRSSSLPEHYGNSTDERSDVTNHVVQSEPPGDFSGSDVEEIRNDSYLQSLVARYNDLFSESRIKAMNILRAYDDDHENNQRIIFALIMTTARQTVELQKTLRNPYGLPPSMSQNMQFRANISRSNLKNMRARIIYEMIHKKGRYFRFHLSPGFTFIKMEEFIDKSIEMFWNFGGTVNGLSLLEAADGEIFDEHKYRRSYDSEYLGPLVNHHIWPCLLQGNRVLVKGEACTKSSSRMNNHSNSRKSRK